MACLRLEQQGFQPLAVQLHTASMPVPAASPDDPFDRLLTAQAELEGLQLVSQQGEVQTSFSFHRPLAHQGEAGLESGSVVGATVRPKTVMWHGRKSGRSG
jgi:hypothetical protein